MDRDQAPDLLVEDSSAPLENYSVTTNDVDGLPTTDEVRAAEDAALEVVAQTPAAADTTAPHGAHERANIIEALLFASDTPLSLQRLTELSGIGSTKQVRLEIAALNDRYTAHGLSFRVVEIAKGYQLQTLPQYQPYLAKLVKQQSQSRLTDAALEALAIVAYKQPIIRADVEAIRGVACGEVLNRLREMGLIKITGRAEIVGRPLLYGTTRKFLDVFGLADLDDLPPMEVFSLRRQTAALAGGGAATPVPIAAAGA